MKKILIFFIIISLSKNIYAKAQYAGAAGAALQTAAVTAGTEATFFQRTREWCSTNPFACVMAGLSAAQLVMTIANYFGSKDAKDGSACQGAYCNTNTTTPPGGPNTPPAGPPDPYTYQSPDPNDPMTPLLRETQRGLRDLRARGYEVNADGSVTGPNGKTTTAAQAASAASSMSPEDQAKLAEIQQAAAVEGKKFADMYGGDGSSETGGGKKRAASSDGAGSGFDMNAYLRSLNRNGDAKRGVAGLSVRAGTDNVGVKESNIFEQASAAYNKDQVLNRGNP